MTDEEKPKKTDVKKGYNAQTSVEQREEYFKLGQNPNTMIQVRNAKKVSDEKK